MFGFLIAPLPSTKKHEERRSNTVLFHFIAVCFLSIHSKTTIMQPKQIWANLAVADVQRTKDFYTAIGFKLNESPGKNDPELVSFAVGQHNFPIMFFETKRLEQAFEGPAADLSKGNEVMFSLWAASPAEADAWAEEVRKAGGRIFSEPKAFGPGYYGFAFADPDGHKWNVFHM